MQLTASFLLTLAHLPLFLASPTPTEKSMAASGPNWTLRSFKRVCNDADTSCTYTYSIDNGADPASPVNYTVTGEPASRASYTNLDKDPYVISSSWSGQFGPDSGFQTLAIVKDKQIVYPAYTDKQLKDGKTVKPDQSYPPQNLP